MGSKEGKLKSSLYMDMKVWQYACYYQGLKEEIKADMEHIKIGQLPAIKKFVNKNYFAIICCHIC